MQLQINDLIVQSVSKEAKTRSQIFEYVRGRPEGESLTLSGLTARLNELVKNGTIDRTPSIRWPYELIYRRAE